MSFAMHIYLRPIPSLLFFLLCSYVVWNWVKWFSSEEKNTLKWKGNVSLAGLCFATVSTTLSAFLFVHATFTGGYPYYHPVELFCLGIGSLTALGGLVAAIRGKGKLRLPVAAISTFNLLIWFADAVVQ